MQSTLFYSNKIENYENEYDHHIDFVFESVAKKRHSYRENRKIAQIVGAKRAQLRANKTKSEWTTTTKKNVCKKIKIHVLYV